MRPLLSALFLTAGCLLSAAPQATAQTVAPAKQWDETFGGSSDDRLTALQQTSDGGYLLGGPSISGISGDKTQATQGANDYWVVKLDAAGTKQWDKTFGSTGDDQLFALQQTRDGGYILGGISRFGISGDKTQAGQGADDYWIVKLDATGTKQWDKSIGGSSDEVLTALQQTSDGGYILGGYSTSGISGDRTQASQGSLDYWVVKLDATGAKQWDRSFGGSGSEQLNGLQQTSDGGYILGGTSTSGISGDKTQASQGNADYWVVKLNPSGSKEWDKTLGGSAYDFLFALQQTRDGGYLLGGYSGSGISGDKTQANHGQSDYWVIKLAADPLATKATTTHSSLQAYPNPTRTQLMLSGPLGTPYQLLNQLGQVVRASQLAAQPLDVQALPAGLYLLRDATTGRTTKLVKE